MPIKSSATISSIRSLFLNTYTSLRFICLQIGLVARLFTLCLGLINGLLLGLTSCFVVFPLVFTGLWILCAPLPIILGEVTWPAGEPLWTWTWIGEESSCCFTGLGDCMAVLMSNGSVWHCVDCCMLVGCCVWTWVNCCALLCNCGVVEIGGEKICIFAEDGFNIWFPWFW